MNNFLDINKPAGRTFVIGDIHGCLRECQVLLEHILYKLNFSKSDLLIFLGDYIDRGVDSKGVLDLLINLKLTKPNIYFLKGNHEEMLLDFLGLDGANGKYYLENGGYEFFSSYGLDADKLSSEHLLSALPAQHIAFIELLNRFIVMPDYIIAHAGLNPLRDLSTQRDQDIYWIREEFLKNMHFFNKPVIFGHTTFKEVFFDLPYKIGIDTALVYGGKLTCIELDQNTLYQVPFGSKKVKVQNRPQSGKSMMSFFAR